MKGGVLLWMRGEGGHFLEVIILIFDWKESAIVTVWSKSAIDDRQQMHYTELFWRFSIVN